MVNKNTLGNLCLAGLTDKQSLTYRITYLLVEVGEPRNRE